MSGFEPFIPVVACAGAKAANKAVKEVTGKSIAKHCKSAAKGLRNIVLRKAGEKASKEAEELLFNKQERAEFVDRLDSLETLLESVASNPAAEDESVKQELLGLQEFLERATARYGEERVDVLNAIDRRINTLHLAFSNATARRDGAKLDDLDAAVREVAAGLGRKTKADFNRQTKESQLEQLEIVPDRVEAKPFAKGGEGEIFMGEYQGEMVVLKKISLVGVTRKKRDKMMKDFATELAIMVKLRSPRIIQVFGVVTTDTTFLGLVMEYCAGGSLRAALDDESGKVTVDLQHVWGLDVALGMAYLYSQGVEHRDLKSANVLLTRERRAKVADFGLSKCEDLRTQLTQPSQGRDAKGTSAYMAPELLKDNVFSEKSDVYSFAMVMWEIWDRGVPWGGLRTEQIITQVLVERTRPKIPEMPRDLRDLMVRAWAHDATERPTFEELAAKLKVSNIDLSELVKLGSLEANLTLSAVLILDAMEEIENSSRANHSRGVGTFWGWVE